MHNIGGHYIILNTTNLSYGYIVTINTSVLILRSWFQLCIDEVSINW